MSATTAAPSYARCLTLARHFRDLECWRESMAYAYLLAEDCPGCVVTAEGVRLAAALHYAAGEMVANEVGLQFVSPACKGVG